MEFSEIRRVLNASILEIESLINMHSADYFDNLIQRIRFPGEDGGGKSMANVLYLSGDMETGIPESLSRRVRKVSIHAVGRYDFILIPCLTKRLLERFSGEMAEMCEMLFRKNLVEGGRLIIGMENGSSIMNLAGADKDPEIYYASFQDINKMRVRLSGGTIEWKDRLCYPLPDLQSMELLCPEGGDIWFLASEYMRRSSAQGESFMDKASDGVLREAFFSSDVTEALFREGKMSEHAPAYLYVLERGKDTGGDKGLSDGNAGQSSADIGFLRMERLETQQAMENSSVVSIRPDEINEENYMSLRRQVEENEIVIRGLLNEIHEEDIVLKKEREEERLTRVHVSNLENVMRIHERDIADFQKKREYFKKNHSKLAEWNDDRAADFKRILPDHSRKRKLLLYIRRTVLHPFKMIPRFFSEKERNLIRGDFLIGSEYLEKGKLHFEKAEEPLVSIIVAAANEVRYTYRLLCAILEHTDQEETPYELILADDSSSDATREIEKYADNIIIMRNTERGGFFSNVNQAAEAARGKYIAVLHQHTAIQDEWLTGLLRLPETQPDVGMVGPMLCWPDDRVYSAGGIVWADGSSEIYGRNCNALEPEYNYVRDVDFLSAPAFLVRTSLWKRSGGFDLGLPYEDLEPAVKSVCLESGQPDPVSTGEEFPVETEDAGKPGSSEEPGSDGVPGFSEEPADVEGSGLLEEQEADSGPELSGGLDTEGLMELSEKQGTVEGSGLSEEPADDGLSIHSEELAHAGKPVLLKKPELPKSTGDTEDTEAVKRLENSEVAGTLEDASLSESLESAGEAAEDFTGAAQAEETEESAESAEVTREEAAAEVLAAGEEKAAEGAQAAGEVQTEGAKEAAEGAQSEEEEKTIGVVGDSEAEEDVEYPVNVEDAEDVEKEENPENSKNIRTTAEMALDIPEASLTIPEEKLDLTDGNTEASSSSETAAETLSPDTESRVQDEFEGRAGEKSAFSSEEKAENADAGVPVHSRTEETAAGKDSGQGDGNPEETELSILLREMVAAVKKREEEGVDLDYYEPFPMTPARRSSFYEEDEQEENQAEKQESEADIPRPVWSWPEEENAEKSEGKQSGESVDVAVESAAAEAENEPEGKEAAEAIEEPEEKMASEAEEEPEEKMASEAEGEPEEILTTESEGNSGEFLTDEPEGDSKGKVTSEVEGKPEEGLIAEAELEPTESLTSELELEPTESLTSELESEGSLNTELAGKPEENLTSELELEPEDSPDGESELVLKESPVAGSEAEPNGNLLVETTGALEEEATEEVLPDELVEEAKDAVLPEDAKGDPQERIAAEVAKTGASELARTDAAEATAEVVKADAEEATAEVVKADAAEASAEVVKADAAEATAEVVKADVAEASAEVVKADAAEATAELAKTDAAGVEGTESARADAAEERKEITFPEDEGKKFTCQMADFCFKIRSLGARVCYEPKSKVYFDGASDLDGTGKAFSDKWQESLVGQCVPGKERNPFRARERGKTARYILMVDHAVPTWDKDAGSRLDYQYIRLFLSRGYKVKFLPDNFVRDNPYTYVLEEQGVEVLYGNNYCAGIWEWIERNKEEIQIAYLNRPHVAARYIDYLTTHTGIRCIFFGHDVHSLRMMREYEVTGDKSLLDDIAYWHNLEFGIMRKAYASYYPSTFEEEYIHSQDPAIPAKAITAYVYDAAVERNLEYEGRRNLLFVGGFGHPPNKDALLWFVGEILPRVRSALPDIKLLVAGSRPDEEVLALNKRDDVEILGYVTDERLHELYQSTRLVVVPLRYGAGVKGKVIDALHEGAVIVTTGCGAEGIPEAEAVMLIQNDADGFAREIISLYPDIEFLKMVSDRAIQFIEHYYSPEAAWEKIRRDFDVPAPSEREEQAAGTGDNEAETNVNINMNMNL